MRKIKPALTAAALTLATLSLFGCKNPNEGLGALPSQGNYKMPPAAPARRMVPIDPTLRASAEAELTRDVTSADPILRANAIEALQKTSGPAQAPRLIAALTDADPLVRFAATMAVGTLRLSPAHDRLLTMANDSDKAVRVGVRFALHRLGDTRFSHELETYAQDPDPQIRSNTALALGLLGEPSAINILKPLRTDPNVPVRLQALESRWRLGDTEARDKLVVGTISKYPDDAIVCVLALAGPRDGTVIRYLRAQLTNDYVETKLAAARAVGMLGQDDGMEVALDAASSSDARQRSMAALALGDIGRSDAQPKLGRLLEDQQPAVRLAAATAILQLKA